MASGGPYTKLGSATSPSYTDTALSNGTTYYYVVAAINSAGQSANSAQVSAVPVASPATDPPAPTATPPVADPSPPPAGVNFTTAPALTGVTVAANRDSAKVFLPFVKGARDYRVMILPSGASVNGLADGTEQVQGATMWCAGETQRYSGESVWIYKGTGNPAIEGQVTVQPGTGYQPYPNNVVNIRVRSTPMNVIEVTGLKQSQTVYVEAIDKLCPFTGIIGLRHQEVEVQRNLWPVSNPAQDVIGATLLTEVTAADTIGRYGNLIYNGHGHDAGTPISQPAAPNSPKVLARTAIILTPDKSAPVPTKFFDDFTDASQPFIAKTPPPDVVNPNPVTGGVMHTSNFLQNDKWNIYSSVDPSNPQTSSTKNTFRNTSQLAAESTFETYVSGGTLRMILGDYVQDIGASITAIPRTLAHLPALNDSKYLHVTFEVNGVATARRYWAFALCGPDSAGRTFKSDGSLAALHFLQPRFHESAGLDPNTAGWNCLQVAPFNGYTGLAGYNYPVADPDTGINPPQYLANNAPTDLRIIANKTLSLPAGQSVQAWGTNMLVADGTGNSINVSPAQMTTPTFNSPAPHSWYYQLDKTGTPINFKSVIAENELQIQPRQKYDFYIARDTLIVYVNGTQRLCNKFTNTPGQLTMAEGYLAFTQTMYHSAAEHSEIQATFYDNSGLRYLLNNTPAVDEKTWDNIGFDENVSAPAGFDATVCYLHKSLGASNNEGP